MNDPRKLMSILAGLGEIYGKEVTKTMADVYWSALADFTDEQVDRACQRGMRVWKCFGRIPNPAEIIECIEGQGGDSSVVAWECLNRSIQRIGPYKSVVFSDSKISRIVEALGGWISVNQWTEDELPYRRNEFIKMYASLHDGGEVRKLHGLIELQNTAMGYLDRIPEPVRIGEEKGALRLEENKG